ncbi:efflux RND transporter periplasmic adaptor subunit [Corynebacterium pygosceleis]|uniref:Efflux RND transporter periplasmic adaptor subunit n=1 Tax=Corynebacterium pygosceleis TaxID=2800406 RepID=A0ABT3WTV4_9CORY|nr:efflux RND transporter periplasmic adaptor subunit [Corynebacterium pygosceleis]MCK7675106.1 efflux RND transporter periplasmic adaptor subunit [Corynebacterium pygosceleis]MCL0120692.1 efflux RND transporter periplasmic adaptor subunit [Corynebacterium pygosceleis]MCX7444232.1 efflux RND transporter periplasmic adaptor subunit [Corynebacterium pygosceleis]
MSLPSLFRSARRRRLFTGAAAALCLAATGCSGGGDGTVLAAHEYRTAEVEDVSRAVQTTATVAAAKTEAVTTALTGPLTSLSVSSGDRVEEGQLLATVDVSQVERELANQRSQQATALTTELNSLEQAEQKHRQYREGLDQSLNPEVNTAEAALRTATTAHEDAVRAFEARKSDAATGRDPRLVEQERALDQARQQVLNGEINLARAGVASAAAALQTDPSVDGVQQSVTTHIGTVEAATALQNSVKDLNNRQEAYTSALQSVDRDLAEAQRQVASTFAAKKEAAVSVESAKLTARQQLESLASGVEQARRAADVARQSVGRGTDHLTRDINASEIRAPFTGVVVTVGAEVGRPVAGSVVTLADDSGMILRTEVPEVDVADLKPGAEVTFTTAATGGKTFHGKVSRVSPVAGAPAGAPGAQQPGAAGTQQSSGAQRPTFPVEITIDGDTRDLRIGGSARARIVLAADKGGLAVPREAVFERNDGTKAVLVVAGAEGPGSRGTVEERRVETGTEGDVTVAVTGGELKKGETVISQGSTRRDLLGTTVTLGDAA